MGLTPRTDDMRFDRRRRRANQKNTTSNTMAPTAAMMLTPTMADSERASLLLLSPCEEAVGTGAGSVLVALPVVEPEPDLLTTLVDKVVLPTVVEASTEVVEGRDGSAEEEDVSGSSVVVDVDVDVDVSRRLVEKSGNDTVIVGCSVAVVFPSSLPSPPSSWAASQGLSKLRNAHGSIPQHPWKLPQW